MRCRRFAAPWPGHLKPEVGGVTGEELLRRPVRLRGIRLGRPVDLLVDTGRQRVLGIEVLCGDEERRFLPFGAAEVRPDEIAVGSTLMLLDEQELRFYRRHATTLRALRQEHAAASLQDVEIAGDGEIVSLLLAGDGGPERAEAALLGSPASSWTVRPT